MSDRVGRQPQYDVFADEFLAHAEDGFFNAHYDRPACLSLLGDVAGRRVLDAACGPGLYAEELIRREADVVGFDQSPRMVQICRERAGRGEFRVHDLADPIGWLPGASVDLVLCALAIDYIDDRVAALREFRRVLRPGGALVMSRGHPTGDWPRHGGSYFGTRVVQETWSKGWLVRYWLAPLEVTCEEVFQAGFLIERRERRVRTPDANAGCRGTSRPLSATVGHMHPESARLAFREMSPDDLDDIAALLGDPEVMTYYPRPKTRKEAAQWIDWNCGLYKTHGYGLWLLTTREGTFVGDCGLTPQIVDGVTELEVGYHVLPARQNYGYATEAAAASRDFARTVLGATRLIAIIHPDNRPSQRVAEKIGLRPEKRTRVHGGRDAVIYAAALDPTVRP